MQQNTQKYFKSPDNVLNHLSPSYSFSTIILHHNCLLTLYLSIIFFFLGNYYMEDSSKHLEYLERYVCMLKKINRVKAEEEKEMHSFSRFHG